MSAVVRSTVRSRSEVLLKEAKWQQLALCTDQWAYTKTVLKSDCVEKYIRSSILLLEFLSVPVWFVLHHFHFTEKVLVDYQ